MKIGIIGPSKVREKEKISELAMAVSESGHEIVLTPDKGSSSEFFAKEYIKNKGKKVYEVVPLEDREFGYSWINLDLGEHINCKTWRNQPEELNEKTDALLCIGYSAGGLIEICYSKWFRKKPVYIIKELVSEKLPEELENSLDLRYVSIREFKDMLK